MNFGNIEPAKIGGLYEAMMGGAREGVPPFAAPFPQTGGTNAPTMPETMPAKHGLAGFFDRLLNPTNSLGQFGQALLAGGGGPLGNAMGYLMQQHAAQAHAGDKFNDWKQQYDYEVGHPKASTAQPYRWERNDGSVMELGPQGPQVLYSDPNPKNFTMQAVHNDDGTITMIPVPLGGAPTGSAPQSLGNGDKPDWSKLGGGVSNGPATFPVRGDFGNFKRAIIGQESGGRYGVPNAQGSGAMGIGQVMPATAKVLAGRLGMPWNPNMMASTSEAGKRYQDAITQAAMKEAWQAGKGNLATAAMYYHGGSDRSGWGPKTHRYASEVLGRMGAH